MAFERAPITPISIPTELLEQVERGNVLLFIGERIASSGGQPVPDLLADELAARGDYDAEEGHTFPELAQAYEDDHGRQALVQFVRDRIEALGDEPQPAHRLLARLVQCDVLVTTALNRRLERAFEEARRPLQVVVRSDDIAFEDERRAQLYKLRGALDQPDTLVLTEDDHERFFDDQESLSVVLQGYLARKTILFIGYDLDDENFKRLHRKVTTALDDFARRSYAFGASPPARVARWCKRFGINVVEADVTAFLQALLDQLAARARPAAEAPALPVIDEPLPTRPYKLLDYYESSDAAIFFGRGRERQELSERIHAHRLTLLFGASGVGKTSLLLAGALPRLEHATPPYVTVYARALEDPAVAIRRAVRRHLPDADLPENGALTEFLMQATAASGPLVIVLDQFEEFFIRLSPQFRATFTADLGALYEARELPAKVVLSLREDWLASVNELERRIPEVFRNRMRVLPLTQEQAREAITAPAERLGVRYEPALLDRLLQDLVGSGSDVLPPQLQLVCSALYGRLRDGERLITLAMYEGLGGARGVLQQYLDDELARLSRDERALARGTLAELVTSQGTKAVKTLDELALALDVDGEALAPVLETLVRARLLRPLEREDGVAAYELAHEYLIREIELGADAKQRKQAEELVRQEVDNWRRFGTLLGADKLALINESRAVLRLAPEAQELLLRSAIEVGDEIPYWLDRVEDPAQRARILADRAQSKIVGVRRRAASVLGTQDQPESVEPLLTLALRDADVGVQDVARAGLVKLAGQRAAVVGDLQTQAMSKNRVERRAALETLAALPLPDVPPRLRAPVATAGARVRTTRAARWTVATPGRRSIAIILMIMALIAGSTYVYALNTRYLYAEYSELYSARVVKVGQGFSWLPLETEISTGVPESQIDRKQLSQIANARLSTFWWEVDKAGYDAWANQLSGTMRPAQQALWLWQIGQHEQASNVLTQAVSGSPENRNDVAQTITALAMTTRNASFVTSAMAANLLKRVIDPKEKLQAQYTAATALAQIVAIKPALTDEVVIPLLSRLADARETSNVQVGAATTIGQLAADEPALATPAMVKALKARLADTNESSDVRGAAATALGQLVIAQHALLTDDMATALLALLGDQRATSDARGAAVTALGQLVVVQPVLADKVAAPLLERIGEASEDQEVNTLVTVLAQIVKARPNLASTEMAATVLRGFAKAQPYSNTPYQYGVLLGSLVAAQPRLADIIVPPLLKTLTNAKEDSTKQDNASYALRQLAEAQPTLADTVVPTLFEHFANMQEASSVRSTCAGALGQLIDARPTLATPAVAAVLLASITNVKEDRDVPYNAANSFGSVVKAQPTLATPEMAVALLARINDRQAGNNEPLAATIALGELVAAQPTLATDEMSNSLLALLADPQSGTDIQGTAITALGQLVTAQHALATNEMASALLVRVADDQSDINLQLQAATALGQLVTAQPKLATPEMAPALFKRINDSGQMYYSREYANALASYAQALYGRASSANQPLNALALPSASEQQFAAAQALFWAAIHNPNQRPAFRRQLGLLVQDRSPITRVWANRGLQLIDIADLAITAANEPPDNSPNGDKLAAYLNFDFFGPQFTWAASAAQDWVDEQRKANEK